MKRKMTRGEDSLKLIYPLDKHGMLLALLTRLDVPGEVAAEDACAIEHSISPETYSA